MTCVNRFSKGSDEYHEVVRSGVLKAIVAFLVPFMVLILVFALLGLTSIGYQIIAYGTGVVGFVWAMAQVDTSR